MLQTPTESYQPHLYCLPLATVPRPSWDSVGRTASGTSKFLRRAWLSPIGSKRVRSHVRQRVLQIGDEVGRVLEPDMQAHESTLVRLRVEATASLRDGRQD